MANIVDIAQNNCCGGLGGACAESFESELCVDSLWWLVLHLVEEDCLHSNAWCAFNRAE